MTQPRSIHRRWHRRKSHGYLKGFNAWEAATKFTTARAHRRDRRRAKAAAARAADPTR